MASEEPGGFDDGLHDRFAVCRVANELKRGGESADIAHHGVFIVLLPKIAAPP